MKGPLLEMDAPQLNAIFGFLADQISDVLWLCTNDYTKQLYVSSQFEKVWGRESTMMYDHRDSWANTLLKEDIDSLTPAFYARMQNINPDPIHYRIVCPDGSIRFIKDVCLDICDAEGKKIALLGLAKPITEAEWEESFSVKDNKTIEPAKNLVTKTLADIISQEITKNATLKAKHLEDTNASKFTILSAGRTIDLTKREAECLYFLVQGKPIKIIARELNISPRTVETYVSNMKIKLKCNRMLELISKIQNHKEIENWSFK